MGGGRGEGERGYGELIFFTKTPNLKKKMRWGRMARVSDFFLQRIQI